jgi:hypothetical protein
MCVMMGGEGERGGLVSIGGGLGRWRRRGVGVGNAEAQTFLIEQTR